MLYFRLIEKSKGEEGEDPKRNLLLLHKTLLQTFSSLILSLIFLVFSALCTTEPKDPLYKKMERKRQRSLQSRAVKLLFIYFVAKPFLQINFVDRLNVKVFATIKILVLTLQLYFDRILLPLVLCWFCNNNIFFVLDISITENIHWLRKYLYLSFLLGRIGPICCCGQPGKEWRTSHCMMAGRALCHEFLLLNQTLIYLMLRRTIGTLVFVPLWGCIGTMCCLVHPNFHIRHCTNRESFYDPPTGVSWHGKGNFEPKNCSGRLLFWWQYNPSLLGL